MDVLEEAYQCFSGRADYAAKIFENENMILYFTFNFMFIEKIILYVQEEVTHFI